MTLSRSRKKVKHESMAAVDSEMRRAGRTELSSPGGYQRPIHSTRSARRGHRTGPTHSLDVAGRESAHSEVAKADPPYEIGGTA